MRGFAVVRRSSVATCVVVLGLVLLLPAVGCRPTPAPPLPPTQAAVTLTETPRLSTPTPTTTWTPSLTPYPPLRWPTATEMATTISTAAAVVATATSEATATEAATVTVPAASTMTSTLPAPTHTPVVQVSPGATPTLLADRPTLVPTAGPQPTRATSTMWQGEYYANPDLSGNPVVARLDAEVAFDWQEGAPAPELAADSFSARWTRRAWFESAVYTFYATMDDGMRVYVDDKLLIDEWRDRAAREVTASRQMSAGVHDVRVEYYERGHIAVARLWWAEEHSFVGWQGRYYADPNLQGNPVMVRDDRVVSFDWGLGSPGEDVPQDRFSVRWTRAMRLADGLYRFRALVDDGMRLWVDGVLVIDAWQDRSLREVTADRTLAGAGPHVFRVEYYDNQFDARIDLSWERIGEPVYPYWQAEYFDNRNLAGSPALVFDERSISHDWGNGAPAPSLPADHFSARWTRQISLVPGRYQFKFRVDDGLRFYVDDKLLIDEWHPTWGERHEIEVDLPPDPKFKIEYFEEGGGARMEFSYEKLKE